MDDRPNNWTPVTEVHTDAATEPLAPVVSEHDAEQHRFLLRMPEGTAELRYRERGPNLLVLYHTEVPQALQGRGIGSRLTHEALEYARAHKLKVVPVCPFVRAYLDRHPEFADVIVGGGR